MSDKIQFKVGNKYENRKGLFEVISIRGDSMIIQWENGEKISTSIEFQQGIIEEMEKERQGREGIKRKYSVNLKKRQGRKLILGNEFNGFKQGDFKGNVTGTTWRRRSCLGGAVTQRLDAGKFDFNSWAVYRRPVIHWADIKHHGSENTWLQAKFLAQLDESNLYYGFYIERSNKPSDKRTDWDAFLSWVKNIENERWLNKISMDNDLSIYDKEQRSFKGVIKSRNYHWKIHGQEGEDMNIDSFSAFLSTLPEIIWVDLVIVKIENKKEVLNKRESIAEDISKLFEILMPLYKAIRHTR
jgi:hypothetical protein